jgi:hypothetical protein
MIGAEVSQGNALPASLTKCPAMLRHERFSGCMGTSTPLPTPCAWLYVSVLATHGTADL